MSKFLLVLVVGAFFLAAPVRAEISPLTESQRAALWENAQKMLKRHPRLLYHEGLSLPDYPGFIVSNEWEHFTMRPPKDAAGMLLGFASLINYNIVAARRSPALLVADASEEVVIAMLSFWRPLFLASATPAEFLANSGMLDIRPNDTTATVFDRIRRGEKGTVENLWLFEAKLTQLVIDKKIGEFDRLFALEVMKDQLLNPVLGIAKCALNLVARAVGIRRTPPIVTFRNSRGSIRIASGLFALYATPIPEVWAREAVSFLNATGYRHVRSVLESEMDFYAVSRIQNMRLWKRAGDLARRHGLSVTDVYWSNIPGLLRPTRPHLDRLLENGLRLLNTERVAVYESTLHPPYEITTKIIEPGAN